MNLKALIIASVIGTVLQIAMVVAGHQIPPLKGFFGPGGMIFSALAGFIYFRMVGGTLSEAAVACGLTGAICAFLGIGLSYLLKDVPMTLLAFGTLASGVAGAIGGIAGKAIGQ